eukprot:3117320-Pleurochrysis_carterae.AAC.3
MGFSRPPCNVSLRSFDWDGEKGSWRFQRAWRRPAIRPVESPLSGTLAKKSAWSDIVAAQRPLTKPTCWVAARRRRGRRGAAAAARRSAVDW